MPPAVVPEPGGTGGWPGGRRDEGAGFSALRTFLVDPTLRVGELVRADLHMQVELHVELHGQWHVELHVGSPCTCMS